MNLTDPTGMTLLLPEPPDYPGVGSAVPVTRPELWIELREGQVVDLICEAAGLSKPRAIAYTELLRAIAGALPKAPILGIVPYEEIPPRLRRRFPDFSKAECEAIAKKIGKALANRLATQYREQGHPYPSAIIVQIESTTPIILATTDLAYRRIAPLTPADKFVILTTTISLTLKTYLPPPVAPPVQPSPPPPPPPAPSPAPPTADSPYVEVSIIPEILAWFRMNKPTPTDGVLSVTVSDAHRIGGLLVSLGKLTKTESWAYLAHVTMMAVLRRDNKYPLPLTQVTDVAKFDAEGWVDRYSDVLTAVTRQGFPVSDVAVTRADYIAGLQLYLAVYTTALAHALTVWGTLELEVIAVGPTPVTHELFHIRKEPGDRHD